MATLLLCLLTRLSPSCLSVCLPMTTCWNDTGPIPRRCRRVAPSRMDCWLPSVGSLTCSGPKLNNDCGGIGVVVFPHIYMIMEYTLTNIVVFQEDVRGADRIRIDGFRTVRAEIIDKSSRCGGEYWLKLKVKRARGHRAGELGPFIWRSERTVKTGISEYAARKKGKSRKRSRSKKRAARRHRA